MISRDRVMTVRDSYRLGLRLGSFEHVSWRLSRKPRFTVLDDLTYAGASRRQRALPIVVDLD